mmetsp:Transcript_23633/g.57910  ORF Transcript_23633/g.57910 Transcript_23633/m.57910 type:complete len:427 (-) Transcript_23633:761-2041(-)
MEATNFRPCVRRSFGGCSAGRQMSSASESDTFSSAQCCVAILGSLPKFNACKPPRCGPRIKRANKPESSLPLRVDENKSFSSWAGLVLASDNASFNFEQGDGDRASNAELLIDGALRMVDGPEAASTDEQKRVMCLMSDTGGGHRASAQAVRDGFEVLYGDKYDINIVDLWSSSSPWPLCHMPKSYFFLVKNPWLWRMSFRCSEPELLHEAMFTGYTAIVGRRFAQEFQEYMPNLVVSVHPLMQHVPLKVLARMKAQPSFCATEVPFTTVVTDLTRCHRTWFHRQVDKCFVATQLVAAQAMKYGLTAKQLACHGLPIRPAFNLPSKPKSELRRQLGMDVSAATVMLVGGGEGMGKLQATAEALVQTLGFFDTISFSSHSCGLHPNAFIQFDNCLVWCSRSQLYRLTVRSSQKAITLSPSCCDLWAQ